MTRFILGFIMVLGAMVFLGCPLRMVIRMSAGDLNTWVGLIGLILGVITGAMFLKRASRWVVGRTPTPLRAPCRPSCSS